MFMCVMSAVCASCIMPFDPEFDDQPFICLNAFPGVEDMVVFSIFPAYSLSNSAEKPGFDPEITFTVNGEIIPVVLNTGFCMSDKYPEDRYVADYKPVPGDEMTVEVSSEGFRSVSARTSVPELFPESKIDYRPVKVGDREYNVVYVTFNDDARTDRAYGVQIYNEVIRISDDSTEVNTYAYAGSQITDEFDMAPVSLDGMRVNFNEWDMDIPGGSLAVWDDTDFNGKENTLSMTVASYTFGGVSGYDSFFEHEYTEHGYDEDGVVYLNAYRVLSHNKLVLYTMSDEFYKYAVAQRLIGDNAGVFAGIAPSNFCYSNVVNGYGAFAGVTSVSTDWITPEFIENNR